MAQEESRVYSQDHEANTKSIYITRDEEEPTLRTDFASAVLISNAAFEIEDDAENDSEVGTVEGDEGVSYSIVDGDPNEIFAIDEESGLVTVSDNTELAAGVYTLTVRAELAGATDRAEVTVTVEEAE